MEEQDFHINIIRGKKKVSPVIQRRGNVYQFTFWCKLSPICVTDLNLYCGRNFLSGIYMYALRDTVRSYLIVHAVVICTYLAINVYWPSIRLNYYRLQSSHPPKVASPSRTSSPPPFRLKIVRPRFNSTFMFRVNSQVKVRAEFSANNRNVLDQTVIQINIIFKWNVLKGMFEV